MCFTYTIAINIFFTSVTHLITTIIYIWIFALLGKFLLRRKFMLVSFLSFSTTYGIFLISNITDSTMDANQH